MPKQAASAPSTETTKPKGGAPGKKRSRSVGKGDTSLISANTRPVLRTPTHDEISERAYALYAGRGFRAGDPVQDWLSAEQQLLSA